MKYNSNIIRQIDKMLYRNKNQTQFQTLNNYVQIQLTLPFTSQNVTNTEARFQ